MPAKRGNCYVAAEALYHLLGGKNSGWVPQVMSVGLDTHWFLRHRATGLVVDPTARQFGKTPPRYEAARGTGFLTKGPSRRAKALMEMMLWQQI